MEAEVRLSQALGDLPALESIYVKAFHHAQERFGTGMEPPAILDDGKTVIMAKQMSWRSLLRRKSPHQPLEPGGTTACTLSLVRKNFDYTIGRML